MKLTKRILLSSCALLIMWPVSNGLSWIKAQGKSPATPPLNTLSSNEKTAGWKLLFDGKTLKGWRGANGAKAEGSGWVIEDGVLRFSPEIGKNVRGPKDLISVDQFESFDLRFDWRLGKGGNSGVKYFVFEPQRGGQSGALGHEFQLLDDDNHPDAKAGIQGNRTAGSLYDMIAPSAKAARAVGEFNEGRVVVRGSRVEHWLNGKKIVEYDRNSEQYKKLLSESKYKTIPGFGDVKKGNVMLQCHGDEVWFRNVKILELSSK